MGISSINGVMGRVSQMVPTVQMGVIYVLMICVIKILIAPWLGVTRIIIDYYPEISIT